MIVTDWPKVWIIVLVGILVAFQIGKVPVSLLDIRAELGIGIMFAGWIVATLHVIRGVFGSVVGRVADEMGHRRVILISLLCVSLASVLGAASPTGSMLLASRLVEGVGVMMILVSAPPMLIRVTSLAHRRLVLGIWGAWMPVGMGVMILASPVILAPFGWRGVWVANALLLLVLAGVFGLVTRPAGPPARAAEADPSVGFWPGVWLTATSGGPLLLAALTAVAAACAYSVSSFLPIFFVEGNGSSVEQAGVLTGVVVLLGALGSIIGARSVARGASVWAVFASASIVVGLSGFGIFATELPFVVRYAFCVVYFISVAVAFSVLFSALPIVAASPALIATTEGLRSQGASLGFMLGPLGVAAVVGRSSWQEVSWLVLGFGALGLLLSLWFRRLERRALASREEPGRP